MSSVVIAGDTSGSVTLSAPAVAGSTVLTLPAVSGTVITTATGQTLTSPVIAGTPTGVGVLTSGTAVASTSGTTIDFTGIPSWAKRITVMFNGVSTNGASIVQVQIGAGSVSTSSYFSTASFGTGVGQYLYATSGFITEAGNAATAVILRYGIVQIVLIGSNTWCFSGNISSGANGQVTSANAGTSPALSGVLDRVRITTVNGTDTFDAGSINIMYE